MANQLNDHIIPRYSGQSEHTDHVPGAAAQLFLNREVLQIPSLISSRSITRSCPILRTRALILCTGAPITHLPNSAVPRPRGPMVWLPSNGRERGKNGVQNAIRVSWTCVEHSSLKDVLDTHTAKVLSANQGRNLENGMRGSTSDDQGPR